MNIQFQHVALIGKYQAAQVDAARQLLEEVAAFVQGLGCEVHIEQDTARHTGIQGHSVLDLSLIHI